MRRIVLILLAGLVLAAAKSPPKISVDELKLQFSLGRAPLADGYKLVGKKSLQVGRDAWWKSIPVAVAPVGAPLTAFHTFTRQNELCISTKTLKGIPGELALTVSGLQVGQTQSGRALRESTLVAREYLLIKHKDGRKVRSQSTPKALFKVPLTEALTDSDPLDYHTVAVPLPEKLPSMFCFTLRGTEQLAIHALRVTPKKPGTATPTGTPTGTGTSIPNQPTATNTPAIPQSTPTATNTVPVAPTNTPAATASATLTASPTASSTSTNTPGGNSSTATPTPTPANCTHYVKPTGSDSNNGTSEVSAWATLQKAATTVGAGSVVCVRAGTYVGFSITTDGTPAARITFRADPGVLVNAKHPSVSAFAGAINLEGASNVTIDGFNVTLATYGTVRANIRSVENSGVIIRNNTIDNASWWGILTGQSADLLVENNTITRTQVQHGAYIANSADNPVVRNNFISGSRGAGIQINADKDLPGDGIISNARVYGNVLLDNCSGESASLNLNGVEDAIIINNTIASQYRNGIAMYQDNQTAGTKRNLVAYNTIIGSAYYGISISGAGSINNRIIGNILFSQGWGSNYRGGLGVENITGLQSDYNILMGRVNRDPSNTEAPAETGSQWRGRGFDTRSIFLEDRYGTPAGALSALFVSPPSWPLTSPQTGDYHLKAGAPAINMGIALQEVMLDRDGQARDGTPDSGSDENGNSPAPTNTPGAISTSTRTPTNTPTRTPTNTPAAGVTNTPAGTATNTPTRTPTATPTNTNAPNAPTATPTPRPGPAAHPYTRFSYLEGRSLSDPAVSRFLNYVNGVRAGGSNYGFESYFYVYAKLLTGNQSYCIDAVADVQISVDSAMADINAGRPPSDLVYNSYLYAGGIIQNLMIVLDHCIGVMSQQQVSTWSRLARQTAYNLRVGFHDDAHYTKDNGGRVNANFSGWPFGNQANNYTYQHNRTFAYAGIVLQASYPEVTTWLIQERLAALSTFLQEMHTTDSGGQIIAGGGSFEGPDYGAFMVWVSHIAGLLKDSGIAVPAVFDAWSRAQAQALAHMMLPSTGDFVSHSLFGSGARDKWAGYEDLDLHHAIETLRLIPPGAPEAMALRYVMKRSKTPYSSAPNRMYASANSVHDLLYIDGPERQPDLLWASHGAGTLSVRSSWSGAASHFLAWTGGLWEESHLAGGDIRGHVQLLANGEYQLANGDQLAGGPTDIQNYHNVLRFPGKTQNDEPGTLSYASLAGGATRITMDMSASYDSPVNWVRTVTYNPAGSELIIRDTWNQAAVSTATASFAVANATASGANTAVLNGGAAQFSVVSGGSLTISSITGAKLMNVAASGGLVEFRVTW